MSGAQEKKSLTVNIAFPVLSSFNEGPFTSLSRKKCFPFTASTVAISLNSCMWQYVNQLHKLTSKYYSQQLEEVIGTDKLITCHFFEIIMFPHLQMWQQNTNSNLPLSDTSERNCFVLLKIIAISQKVLDFFMGTA